MIAVSNLGKSFGTQDLFQGVSLQLDPGARYGLVGANGSGKTTFLRILAGDLDPDEGAVSVPKRARLGVLEQDHFRYEAEPILDVVMMGHRELWQAMHAKREILAAPPEAFDVARFAAAEERVQHHDGYTMESRAGEILEGLGIPAAVHPQALSTLSGGFKLRVLLAQVLASAPDALLLDEPTNHLDIVSIRWLEKFLVAFAGPLIVISHDHRFLDNVATHILDVDYGTIALYPGDYTAFQAAKIAERARREGENVRREAEIARHQAFADRFRAKASKARQAQSRLKQIERIEIEPLPQSSRRSPSFRFRQHRPSGKVALKLEGITKSFGERRVLDGVSLEVRRGDRLAVIGPNGIGKSTLLGIMVGRHQADGGRVTWGHEARPGYFAQDHKEQLGGGAQSAEAWLWEACPGEGIGFVRAQLGRVLFSGDEALKAVGKLSGGEAARLLFARLAVEQPNILVLDEPTNHLDLEGIEALVEALKVFDGTVILVAHDRWFVGELADRILEITPGGMRDFHGSYEAYVESCGDDHLDRARGALATPATAGRKSPPAPRHAAAARRNGKGSSRRTSDPAVERERERLFTEIEDLEKRVAEIHALFGDARLYEQSAHAEIRALEEEAHDKTARIDLLFAEWSRIEQDSNPLTRT